MVLKNVQSVRGMNDFLPKDTVLYRYIEDVLINILINYGYNEIRCPIIETTQLFKRAIGMITDVVEKEMYSFSDRNGKNVTLRPEGTAGCVRACLEHGLFYHSKEQRLWYIGPMFRRERPQRGRFRQFHQLSVEMFGSIGPGIDAEIIMMTARFWDVLGITKYLSLELNSIGSLAARSLYCKDLLKFLFDNIDYLDENSRRRLYSNPIRILDSKDKNIQRLLLNGPVLSEYLDSECRVHFNDLCEILNENKVSYTINSRLIRGLDYYNRTVFEWINNSYFGAQNTICGGGRYDSLVSELGGYSMPAIGCSIGLDRLFLLINEIHSKYYQNISSAKVDIYIAIYTVSDHKFAILLSERIRDVLPFLRLQVSYSDGNIKKHFKMAYKYGSRVVVVVGKSNDSNILKNHVLLKDFLSGKVEELLENVLINRLLSIFLG